MSTVDFAALEIEDLRRELSLCLDKVQQYNSIHAKECYFGDLNRDDDVVMREFYERNYSTLINLSGHQKAYIGLLQALGEKEKSWAAKKAGDVGFKHGVFAGALLGVLIVAPLLAVVF
jgi:hypothetical protein